MATNQMGLASKAKLTAIANAIRSKLGVSTQYSLDDMATAIASISGGGGITPTGTKQITITQNGTTTEDVTNYASAEITVNVPTSGITPTGTIQITENGTFDVTQYASANVNVPSSGGGEKTLTKLGEYSVSSAVSRIDITLTEQMLSCENLYIKFDALTLSAADWVYPTLNSYSTSGNGMGYTVKQTSFTGTIVCTPIKTAFSVTNRLFLGSLISVLKTVAIESPSTLNLRPYTSGVTFNSGTVEVWGYV